VSERGSSDGPREIHTSGFLDRVKALTDRSLDSSLLFVLGAGASRQSGIKTGDEMVADWLEMLRAEEPDRDLDTTQQGSWATAARLEIKKFDPTDPAASYSQIFARTYRGRRGEGFDYLETEVAGRDPSFGYSVLAQILADTRHKFVVTTNFDDLVAEALGIYTTATPVIRGHESLAGFIRHHPVRPQIVKVHQYLFYAQNSTAKQLKALPTGFASALKELFTAHVPVVIGYGGNDGCLMKVLTEGPLDLQQGMYWCYLRSAGRPRQDILDLVGRTGGWLVPIDGFDELMIDLQDTLGLDVLDEFLNTRGDERAARYVATRTAILQARSVHPEPVLQPDERPPADTLRDEGAEAPRALRVVRSFVAESARTPQRWDDLARRESDEDRRAEVYEKGVRALPDSAEMATLAALFLEGSVATERRAEDLHFRAVALAPSDSAVLTNYANFLTDVRQDHDAAAALYVRALEADPNRVATLGNYANFLRNVRQDYDAAEVLYRRVLDIDPLRPSTLGNYALLLAEDRQDYDAAEELYKRALEQDPNHANHLANYATFLTNIREDHATAERLYRRALEGDPDNANCLRDYADFLMNVRQDYSTAEALVARSLEIDPSDTDDFGL
jgi:tetratricopeptide (TPR) repeat protein